MGVGDNWGEDAAVIIDVGYSERGRGCKGVVCIFSECKFILYRGYSILEWG